MSKRYDPNTLHWWAKPEESLSFTLEEPILTEDDGKLLLFKIVEQASRDYANFFDAKGGKDRENFLSAEAFLFDDDYLIDFGEEVFSLEEILHILDLEVEWYRRKVIALKEKREEDRRQRKLAAT